MAITGARQVGKTTLVRQMYGDLRYVNLDALENRAVVRDTPAASWAAAIGNAIIDEAQKEPTVFEKVKYAYDAGDVAFSVLTGSSRFLLMGKVKETLAGRAFVYELWPTMASELVSLHAEPTPPLLDRLLPGARPMGAVLSAEPKRLLAEPGARAREAFDHLRHWGGMPELLRLDDADRKQWLRSYAQTFLERDLRDLANLAELEPFAKLQRLVMLRTAGLLSYSALARDAGVAATTARRYLEFLRISYQALLLQPYYRNLTSSVVKSPKVYWTDVGLLRSALGHWGQLTGEQFETLVVVEIHKWIQTMGRDVRMYFYRTRSGAEVDVVLETAAGVVGVEIKSRDRGLSGDARALRRLAGALGEAWRGGLVVHDGPELELLDEAADIWAVPAHRLLT